MKGFAVQVDTSLTPEQAFEAVTDWPAHSRHVPGTRVEVTRATGGVGEEFVGTTRIGPVVVEDSMAVTGWEPVGPEGTGSCEITKTGSRVTGGVRVTVSAHLQGARVDWYEEIGLAPRVLDLLARPFIAVSGRFLFGRVVRGLLADAERREGLRGD